MERKEKEFEEKVARVGADTLKSLCESAGVLPPSSPEERVRRLAESITLIVQSVQHLKK